MDKRLLILLLIMTVMPVTADKLYSLKLGVTDGMLTFTSVDLIDGAYEQVQSSDAVYELRDNEGKSIASGSFALPAQGQFVLHIPYNAKAHGISIRKGEITLLTVPVMQFADTCGDSICDSQESYYDCSEDCASGSADGYCDSIADGICDPDCGSEDDDCKTKPGEMAAEETVHNVEPVDSVPVESIKAKTDELSHTSEDNADNGVLVKALAIGGSAFALMILMTALLLKRTGNGKRIAKLQDLILERKGAYQQDQIWQSLRKQGYSDDEIRAAYDQIGKGR